MNQQMGVFEFIQCRLKGANQVRRQGGDKADRVGEDDLPFAGKSEAARGGV